MGRAFSVLRLNQTLLLEGLVSLGLRYLPRGRELSELRLPWRRLRSLISDEVL